MHLNPSRRMVKLRRFFQSEGRLMFLREPAQAGLLCVGQRLCATATRVHLSTEQIDFALGNISPGDCKLIIYSIYGERSSPISK
jgi:hypothetical protein